MTSGVYDIEFRGRGDHVEHRLPFIAGRAPTSSFNKGIPQQQMRRARAARAPCRRGRTHQQLPDHLGILPRLHDADRARRCLSASPPLDRALRIQAESRRSDSPSSVCESPPTMTSAPSIVGRQIERRCGIGSASAERCDRRPARCQLVDIGLCRRGLVQELRRVQRAGRVLGLAGDIDTDDADLLPQWSPRTT
jgi:hypothetical protein